MRGARPHDWNDVIDRSALEQAREGLGGRDMEEAAHLGSKPKKSTFEVRGPAAALHACRIRKSGNGLPESTSTFPTHTSSLYCFSVPCGRLCSVEPSGNMSVI